MKLVVSLLAAISLVGPAALAQRKGGGGSEYKAPAQRAQSTRSEEPKTPSYQKSAPSQKQDRSSNYNSYNSYKQPKSQEAKPAPQAAPQSRYSDYNKQPKDNSDRNRPTAQPEARTPSPESNNRYSSNSRPASNTSARQPRPTETAAQRQQREESQSDQTRANLNPDVRQKVAANATVSQTDSQKRNGTFTERNKDTNTTFVRNAQTGKVIAKYDDKTGTDTFHSAGVKTDVQKDASGHVVSETKTYSGATRATTYERDPSTGRVTQYTRTTTINHVNIYESNRTYVRISSNYGYGYYDVYRPEWWGTPSGWGYVYGTYRYPVYTGIFVGWNGYGPYWGPSGFVAFASGYSCGWSGCWSNFFGAGYGWWSYSPFGYPYYASYVFPAWYQPVYPSLSWWLADYVLSTAAETDYLYRASADHAEFEVAKSDAINQIQGDKTNDQGYGLTHQIRQIIAGQVEEMVSIVKKKNDGIMSEQDAYNELDATNMADKGHLFTVNTPVSTATVTDDDGNTIPCTLQAGDLVGEFYTTQDDGTVVRQDPIAVSTDVTDDNPSGQKFVATMYVKASKYGSCAPNQIVTVDVSALQDMVDDEFASVEKGMGEAIARHIGF